MSWSVWVECNLEVDLLSELLGKSILVGLFNEEDVEMGMLLRIGLRQLRKEIDLLGERLSPTLPNPFLIETDP